MIMMKIKMIILRLINLNKYNFMTILKYEIYFKIYYFRNIIKSLIFII